MYNQIREDTIFLMFYASVAMLALIACCYLLFRRSNGLYDGYSLDDHHIAHDAARP